MPFFSLFRTVSPFFIQALELGKSALLLNEISSRRIQFVEGKQLGSSIIDEHHDDSNNFTVLLGPPGLVSSEENGNYSTEIRGSSKSEDGVACGATGDEYFENGDKKCGVRVDLEWKDIRKVNLLILII